MKKLTIIFLILILHIGLFAQTKRKNRSVSKSKVLGKECERMVSLGVLPPNLVKKLHKPKYPASARMLGIKDNVSLRVKINTKGKVIEAKVLKGHILLQKVSLDAAWKSKFGILRISKVNPICYFAIIVYKFSY